jgi:DNA ligase-1
MAVLERLRGYYRTMDLRELVDVSTAVAQTGGRLEKIARLAALLERLPHDEVEIVVGFLTGSPRQGRLGVGWSQLSDARAAVDGTTPPAGHAATPLTVRELDEVFERLTKIAGRGSTRERVALLRDLLSRVTPDERDFIVRLIFGELRQGALEGVLLEAIARAARVPAATVRRAAMMAGALGPVARAALEDGESALSAFIVQLFRPLQPMLAETAADLSDALAYSANGSLEVKLDGARIQVHKEGDEVKAFSRNLRDVTAAVPEVVDVVRALPARSAILDGEVIALRPDATPQPFQVTMQRFGRRLNVDEMRQTLPLSPFFFDLLYLDGNSLLDEPQSRRFGALAGLAPAPLVIPHLAGATPDEAGAFLDAALRRGHEGVMVKAPDAPYAAGGRGRAWLKVKSVRTLDLAVLAVEWGSGRRKGWLSNLHLGARDPERGGFVMLGKTFKGLTDETLTWQTRELLAREIGRDNYTVYVRPELVVEIAFNDIQESPQYPGGLALRFARVKRYRTDKTGEQADTIADVQAIFTQMTGKVAPARR